MHEYGSRQEVKKGVAKMTTGGLRKKDIIKRRVVAADGSVSFRYVSRAKHEAAMHNPALKEWRLAVTAVIKKHPGWSVGDAVAHLQGKRARSRSL